MTALKSGAAEYTQDFAFPDGTTDLGDGTTIGSSTGVNQVIGEALRLSSTETGSEFSSFRIPALAESSTGWTATFNITLTDAVGGNPPADGFTLSYGAIPALSTNDSGPSGHGAAEAGHGSGNEISFQVDTWNNNDPSAGLGILQNGTVLAGGRIDGIVVPSDGSVSGIVTIVWTPLTVDFTTTGLQTNAAFDNLGHTFIGDDSHSWVFSARTGGATEDLIIDNLVITTGDPDTDGDGLPDSWEIFYGLDHEDNGLNPNNDGGVGDPDQGAAGDPDLDTLTNANEFAGGTDPMSDDTDGDGLLDQFETKTGIYVGPMDTGTDPRRVDTDDDGYEDGVEDNTGTYVDEDNTGTDPNNADSDEDGLPDGTEIAVGRDPNIPDAPAPGPNYAQDFTNFPDGSMVLGDGSVIGSTSGVNQVVGEALRLSSSATTGERSSFRIPSISGSAAGWTATFDYTITDAVGGNPPADGFTLSYGMIPALTTNDASADGHGAAEAGHGSGNEISFQFDTWNNNDPSAGLGILVNGGLLADGRVDGILVPNDGSVSGTATIAWTPEATSFTTTGLTTNAAFVDMDHGFFGNDDYSWVFSARTGGATQDLFIDNIVIGAGGPSGDSFKITGIERVFVPANGADPDSYSVTITWESRDDQFYGIDASSDLGYAVGEWNNELEDSWQAESGQATTSFTETLVPVNAQRRFYRIRNTTIAQ